MRGTMLWFDETKDFGFISTEEGERIYVHRSGFQAGEAPVGRCAGRPVELTATDDGAQRVAVEVSMVPDELNRRARRHSSNLRAVWP